MALDAAAFISEFPEFADVNTANPALVARTLRAAAAYCDATLWGARYRDGVFTKCAHLLSLSPFGESARLAKGSKETIYSIQFDDMIAALPVRMLVT